MDFIIYLPKSKGYNTILVVVCRLTKIKHFTPYNDTYNAKEVSCLYLGYI